MSILADIAVGKTSGAEVCFLIALIVAGLAAIFYVMAKSIPAALVAVSLALVAFGWLLL